MQVKRIDKVNISEISQPTMRVHELQSRASESNGHDENDPTTPFNETESFHSIWEALRWKQIRTRVPVCFKKTIRSRYMLANLVYLGYTIGFLVADFSFPMNASTNTTSTDDTSNISYTTQMTTTSILDQPAGDPPVVNKLYFSKFRLIRFSRINEFSNRYIL